MLPLPYDAEPFAFAVVPGLSEVPDGVVLKDGGSTVALAAGDAVCACAAQIAIVDSNAINAFAWVFISVPFDVD